MNQATIDFIHEHREDDVRRLALKGVGKSDIDLPLALQQIAGWQMARHKLPTWAAVEGIFYPPHLNMEQCSSEQTAKYKQCIIHHTPLELCSPATDGTQECTKDGTFIDLTGGLGIDFYFMSQGFERRIYVEQQPTLCDIARHNFALLGLECSVVCDNAADYLRRIDHASVIYLDPARRDIQGKRTYSIADCTPNVLELLPLLCEKADSIILKLSPMLDWHKAVEDLKANTQGIMHHYFAVYIVSVQNECKELLIEMRNEKGGMRNEAPNEGLRVVCVNLLHNGEKQVFIKMKNEQLEMRDGNEGMRKDVSLRWQAASQTVRCPSSATLFLYEPNASIMKAGCFDEIALFYHIQELSANSHLFIADHEVTDFPGRRFRVEATCSMNKRELKDSLKGMTHANIAVRNFPMSAESLRKRLNLKDGGDVFIFATTMSDATHQLFICRKIA